MLVHWKILVHWFGLLATWPQVDYFISGPPFLHFKNQENCNVVNKYGEWPTLSLSVAFPNPSWSLLHPLPSSSPARLLRVLSQLEWTSQTGAHLFAFPSSSFGFSFKLFPNFLSCRISCSVVFLQFPFCFHIFTQTPEHSPLSPFFLLSYHFVVLQRLPLQVPACHRKRSSGKRHSLILPSLTLESSESLGLWRYWHS